MYDLIFKYVWLIDQKFGSWSKYSLGCFTRMLIFLKNRGKLKVALFIVSLGVSTVETNQDRDFSSCRDVSFWTVETFLTVEKSVFELSRFRLLNMSRRHFWTVETFLTVEKSVFELSRLRLLNMSWCQFLNCLSFLDSWEVSFWTIEIETSQHVETSFLSCQDFLDSREVRFWTIEIETSQHVDTSFLNCRDFLDSRDVSFWTIEIETSQHVVMSVFELSKLSRQLRSHFLNYLDQDFSICRDVIFQTVETFLTVEKSVFELSRSRVLVKTLSKIKTWGYQYPVKIWLFKVSRLSWHIKKLFLNCWNFLSSRDVSFWTVETFSTVQKSVFELSRFRDSVKTLSKIKTWGYQYPVKTWLFKVSRLSRDIKKLFLNCRESLDNQDVRFWTVKTNQINRVMYSTYVWIMSKT